MVLFAQSGFFADASRLTEAVTAGELTVDVGQTTTFRYTATDFAGNTGSCQVAVQVSDVDECDDGSHTCHADAVCENLVVDRGDQASGTYSCTCQEGYEGDGWECNPSHKNCWDLKQAGVDADGVYEVNVNGRMLAVYCDMSRDGGGWTMVMKYASGSKQGDPRSPPAPAPNTVAKDKSFCADGGTFGACEDMGWDHELVVPNIRGGQTHRHSFDDWNALARTGDTHTRYRQGSSW